MPLKIRNLEAIRARDPHLAEALDDILSITETSARKVVVNPQGTVLAPQAPNSFQVSALNGMVHATIQDQNPRTKGINYFVDWDTDANFQNPHTVHLGAGRDYLNFHGAGTYYFRAYAQYQDGPRSEYIYHSQAVSPGGSIAPPQILPGTGSGTSEQGGHGFGRDPFVSPRTTPGKPPRIW